MNLKDKVRIDYQDEGVIESIGKSVNYKDIKEAMNEDQYAILELTMRLRKLWDSSSKEKPFNLADVLRELEEYYKERKEIFGDWQQ